MGMTETTHLPSKALLTRNERKPMGITEQVDERLRRIQEADWRDLPRGYYAIEVTDWNDDECPTIGYQIYERKVGRTTKTGRRIGRDALESRFVKIEGATDSQVDEYFRNDYDQQVDVSHLLDDPDYHRREFGRFTGRCGCCGRTLTDPDSKMRGIGPECGRGLS